MKCLVSVFALFIFDLSLSNLFAAPNVISAYRDPKQDYRELANKWLGHNLSENLNGNSAYDSAVPFNKLNAGLISNWKSSLSPIEVFNWIRDNRGINHKGEMRRLSWLFPDDGCFARAELAVQELEGRFYLSPSKLFIFGNLEVKTPNNPNGEVSWWYHVVPAFRSGKKIFIFDPAIQPQRPLLLEEWIPTMGISLSDDFTVSICKAHTYQPDDDCFNPEKRNQAMNDQHSYLEYEESRLEELKIDANRALKDLPPWRTKEEENFICSLNPICQLSRKDTDMQKTWRR